MAKIKELRLAKGLSQAALVEKAGISMATINRLENGKVKAHKSVLRLIAQALEVNPSELEEIPVKKEVPS
jgi:transcriptional regulator with XRE-family HTH domain